MSNYIESYVTSQIPQSYNVESSRVANLIPEQQRETADTLIRLLEDYYRFLNAEGMPSQEIESITKEQDIDRASLAYIDQIQKEIAKTFPESLRFNKVSFYKRVVDYYSSRGTESSAIAFFKLFFDETIEIFYPKDSLFRLSEGNWQRKDNINLLSKVSGYTQGEYSLSNDNIGATMDFFNRPALSHPTKFYVHAADGDSYVTGSPSWNDLSGDGHNALLRGGLETNYLLSEKAYEFNNGTTGEYAVITNLNYGDGKTIAEMSCFVWMRTDYDSGTTDGTFNDSNWALIDFDRSEVFNLFINGDGFLSFAGKTSNQGGIGSNMTNGSNANFDIAANGRAAGDTAGAVDTSLKVNDGNYHYVGVTFSVANQRIILWIDGVAKFVATGNGSLTALGTNGAKRFGVIGDGSEAGTGTDENDYNNPALNNRWFDGAISAIHLHEVEVCSDDGTIAIDDTNTNVTANKNATTVSTYPAKQYGTLSSINLLRQESIGGNYTEEPNAAQSLDDSLKLYYDFGKDSSYEHGTSIVNDISNYGEVDGEIQCDYCTHTTNALQFNPALAPNSNSSTDTILVEGLINQLSPATQHTFVTWIKKDNFEKTNAYGDYVGYSYSTIFSYRDIYSEKSQNLLIRHEDGAIGRFMPIPSNQLGIRTTSSGTQFPRYPATGLPFITGFFGQENNMFTQDYQAFSTTNKITDNDWHMVAVRADASGNGSIDISVDGGTWENIYTGTDTVAAQTFDLSTLPASGRPLNLSIGNFRSSNFATTGWCPRVFQFPEGGTQGTAAGNTSQVALPFSGEINSFYSYDKELSQSEVTALYNATESFVKDGIVLGEDRYYYEIGYTGVEHADVSSNTQYVEFDDIEGKPKLVNLEFSVKDNVVTGGDYLDRRGFASNINKLQDSNYWQEFSYEIRSGIESSKWLNEFNNLVHPAGMKLFAALVLKIFQANEWDDHYILEYYNLKRQLAEEGQYDPLEKGALEQSIKNLEDEINSLYRLTGINTDYSKDFSWIRDPQTDANNPTAYGVPTFQPGYLYKDFANLTFIIQALLTPTDGAVTEEEQHWINVGKNYFAFIILSFISESSENVNQRMYSQYALGQLKFIAEAGPMSQYKDYRLNQGAIEDTFNPEQPLKFTALSSFIEAFGVFDILPYVRGSFSGTESSSAPATTASGYDLSSREVDGDGTSYDNSSIDVERTDLGIQ